MNILQIDEDRMYPYGYLTPIPQGQVGFSQLEFKFSPHWDMVDPKGLIAQFVQGDLVINQAIVNRKCSIPSELKVGSFLLFVRGYSSNQVIIATVNGVSLEVVPGAKDGGTPSIPPDPDLYQDILKAFNNKVPEGGSEGQVLTKTLDGNQWRTPSGGTTPGGTSDYTRLENKPKINGHELVGDTPSTNLGIKDGRDGKTPIKGVDYFTPLEVQSIEQGAAALVRVPTSLSQLQDDSEHRTVTDAQKELWNHKQPAGAYATKADLEKKQDKGNYLTKESDPTVPSWAKQPKKPTYTAEEVGALPEDTRIPANTSDLINDRGFISSPYTMEETAAGTKELQPNVFCQFTAPLASLDVTVAPSEGYAEYVFKFTTSGSGCNLSIPAEFSWDGGKAPTLESNKTYQVVLFSGTAYISGGVPV